MHTYMYYKYSKRYTHIEKGLRITYEFIQSQTTSHHYKVGTTSLKYYYLYNILYLLQL